MGIEPTPEAWQASVLPLNYDRVCLSTVLILLEKHDSVNINFTNFYDFLLFLKPDCQEPVLQA